MTNTFRDALQELHTSIQLYTGQNPAAADVHPAELTRRLMDAMAASADALAQPEPEAPTDEARQEFIEQVQRAQHVAIREGECPRFDLVECALAFCRETIPPAPEPVAPTDSERIGAAFVMGQTGAPPSEVERLAFESWMRGHCWQVEGVWNGITYGDRDLTRISSVDVGAMQTRRMWATWRDCSALTRYGTPANTKEELK